MTAHGEPPPPRRRKIRLSIAEAITVAILAALAAVVAYHKWQESRLQQLLYYGEAPIAELDALQPFRGQPHYSRNFEEFIVRDFFQERRDGIFLDVGANHYKQDNNTYSLETALGWSGIAIDALDEFAADYQAHRPRTRFVAMFASDVVGGRVEFFVPSDNAASSSTAASTMRNGHPGEARVVPTTTLTAVLDQAGIARIDFLSMDIELAEPKALAGFDIDRFKPAFVCIEAHRQVRQQILDYFARHGYVALGKYLRIDPYNLYFAPLSR